MTDCCDASKPNKSVVLLCPTCVGKGKKVALETLQCQLKPSAMRRLEGDTDFFFCQQPECKTVYFNQSQTFSVQDLRESVFQKAASGDTWVCYCFGFSRAEVEADAEQSPPEIASQISAWVRQGLCACELRNPQGSCCLGNIIQLQKALM